MSDDDHNERTSNPDRRGALRSVAGVGLSALAASVATACVGGGRPADAQGPDGDTLTANDMIGKTLRVFHTGDALTLDYSESRLNIELGPDDRIVRVYVG